MFKVNDNFTKLPSSYLFSEVARRVRVYTETHPEAEVIRMGIGDVTRPLCPAVVDALHRAVDDEAHGETFHGYGPEQGYDFLVSKIVDYDYRRHGIDVAADEVFVSDGAKSDTGNIGDILDSQPYSCHRSCISRIYRHKRDGRTRRPTRNRRTLECYRVSAMHGRKWFRPHTPRRQSRCDISVLPQQSYRHHTHPQPTESMGRLLPQTRSSTALDAAYEAFIREDDVPTPSTRLKVREKWPSSFAAFPRLPDSQAYDWVIP